MGKSLLQVVGLCAAFLLVLVACESESAPRPTSDRTSSPEPTAEPKRRCPRTAVPHERPGVRALAFPRGPGPAYIGLGTSGTLHYTEDARRHDGWYYNKFLLAIAPSYRLFLGVNGRRNDGREIVRWHNGPFPGKSQLVLDIPADEDGSGWRYAAGDILIRAPGCYVIRLEGNNFVEEVPFRAKR